MTRVSRNGVLAVLAIVLLLAVPDIANVTPLSFSIIHQGILFGMAAMGLNLLLRHTELVSFGHTAFFGAGAYGVAVLTAHYEVSNGLLLLLGAALAATAIALLVGYLVAGYLDIYFALLTLAFNQVLFAFVLQSGFFNYNDGLRVRVGADRPSLLGIDRWLVSTFGADPIVAYDYVLYYLTVVVLLVMVAVTWKIVNSPFGRALDAIGQDRTRARFIGIPVDRYVWIAFTLSGLYGGIAGGLFALLQLHVRPEPVLFVFVSGEILFMAIIGGIGTIVGPIVGGIVLIYLLRLARFYFEYYHALTGLVLLVVVFFLPEGILGSLPTFRAGLERRLRDPTLVRGDAATVSTTIRQRLYRAATTVRILVFGVK
ncbi:branched-chain amino acid ABC transporter permease [Natronosalvus halobius]|uniref:branched-chain amino acid ABC transporter permease n=1 Tax=Natronosalvus halobius TaxID=2953746 RepID=UPI00209FDA50|nr:branched-chain amino acid ABC transporter permease [Natronosalvus halobius]USZ73291.1 branched-chain amino acid ABC transporter permease [Natronosalvus halobius]